MWIFLNIRTCCTRVGIKLWCWSKQRAPLQRELPSHLPRWVFLPGAALPPKKFPFGVQIPVWQGFTHMAECFGTRGNEDLQQNSWQEWKPFKKWCWAGHLWDGNSLWWSVIPQPCISPSLDVFRARWDGAWSNLGQCKVSLSQREELEGAAGSWIQWWSSPK